MNVINAINAAKSNGAITIALTGLTNNQLSKDSNFSINVPSQNTQRIQECHITIGHILCGMIEDYFINDKKT